MRKPVPQGHKGQYERYEAWAKEYGFFGDFKAECRKRLPDPKRATPEDWVEAAEGIWADTEADFHYYRQFAC